MRKLRESSRSVVSLCLAIGDRVNPPGCSPGIPARSGANGIAARGSSDRSHSALHALRGAHPAPGEIGRLECTFGPSLRRALQTRTDQVGPSLPAEMDTFHLCQLLSDSRALKAES